MDREGVMVTLTCILSKQLKAAYTLLVYLREKEPDTMLDEVCYHMEEIMHILGEEW